MTINELIKDIRKRLEQNIFKSETAVRQGIVDPLLRSLAWPTGNTEVVFPEYPVGKGKVDYALCHPPSRPRVFIEAKQVGNIKGAEEQLFGYDSRIRVPIAVLTDGQKWQFFHPTGEGTWTDRKVCELDLTAGDSTENAECFNKYLNYDSIRSDAAVNAIREDYGNVTRHRMIEEGLPNAWRTLVQEADKLLLKVVAEKTENLCGHLPDNQQVFAFLKSLKSEKLPLVHPDPDHSINPSQHYDGENKPLKPDIAQQLIIEIFGGVGKTKKKKIVDNVKNTHLDRGGLPAETVHVDQLFASALRGLGNANLAKNVDRGYWEIY